MTVYRVHRRVQDDDGSWHIVLRRHDAAGGTPDVELEAGDLQLRVLGDEAGQRFTIGRGVGVELRLLD
jgi:hypothetical protein